MLQAAVFLNGSLMPMTAAIDSDEIRTAPTLPKVLICMPTPGVVKTRTVNSLDGLVAFTLEKGVATLGFYFDEKRSVIAGARDRIAEYGKSKGFDFVCFIDSDMQFPKGALARLVTHNRDVCGVMYNKRTLQLDPVGQVEDFSGGLVEAKFRSLPWEVERIAPIPFSVSCARFFGQRDSLALGIKAR